MQENTRVKILQLLKLTNKIIKPRYESHLYEVAFFISKYQEAD